jgi:hypothetical protein
MNSESFPLPPPSPSPLPLSLSLFRTDGIPLAAVPFPCESRGARDAASYIYIYIYSALGGRP